MEGKPKNNAEIEKEEESMSANVNKEGQEKHIIDCDADPFIPDGWKVKEHQKGGQFEWDPAKVEFYPNAHRCRMDGYAFSKNYAVIKSAINANVLDYLLANPHLIPEEWESKEVFFWGTIYRGPAGGDLCVRYLYCDGGTWHWERYRLASDWDVSYLAALRKD